MRKFGVAIILSVLMLGGVIQAQINDPINPPPEFPTVPLEPACYTWIGCRFTEFVWEIGTITWDCMDGHCWIQEFVPINNESDCFGGEERGDCSGW